MFGYKIIKENDVVIKKVKDRFWQKEAEFIIYEHKGKGWVYKVSGEPIKVDDISKLIYYNMVKVK